jgi:hypothetical protein
MCLFSCESPFLELNFCYSSLNLGCVYFPRKRLSPYTGGFLHFIHIPGGLFNPRPILDISYILPKMLPLPQESALALWLRQVPVTPTKPPDVLTSKVGLDFSTLVHAQIYLVLHDGCLGWSLFLHCQLAFDLEFIVSHRDSRSPQL